EHLTARPRGRAPALETVKVGSEVRTGDLQYRRVRLPDDSVLSLNENTTARLVADRRLALPEGGGFVEVAPRPGGDRFVVSTPRREITALGTRFAVRADGRQTGVLVTQGTVKVSGLEGVLKAGQRLAGDTVSVAPRASYALAW